jgi:uracil-DNA glycosylase family 4
MSALTELYEQIKACHKCDIAKIRTKAVPGEGPENAEIMFIGEAPGWNEDKQGRPFVGQAGQFLDKLLASINLDRNKVYITNVIKTRPPDNRDPSPIEIQNCAPYLDMQLEILKPKMIVTLGRYSMARFFPGKTISKIHGTAVKKDGIIYFAMYHPAAALHQGNLRQTIEEDMKKIPVFLAENTKAPETKSKEAPAQQLNLFEV